MDTVDEEKYKKLGLFFDVLLESFFNSAVDFARRQPHDKEEEALKIVDSLVAGLVQNLRSLATVLEPPYDRIIPEALYRMIQRKDLDLQVQYPDRN